MDFIEAANKRCFCMYCKHENARNTECELDGRFVTDLSFCENFEKGEGKTVNMR